MVKLVFKLLNLSLFTESAENTKKSTQRNLSEVSDKKRTQLGAKTRMWMDRLG